ncbi:flagellar motor stator protein MotA [Chitinimonas viridis]|uniref:Flagellar motor stator protein MotA n=2 Tax=Chitinimonas TaxID=240411 RepID=A0ABT8B194_9NEIS|nr:MULTISPECIES: flagellar motor stator protein MotA [Chitinimonas]MDN3575994.1 flagellar motor stator protein MotA [Chitinimonas viridis]GLR14281.1 flagellar motor protein MotA [Chitinimonas prasina]
MFVVIGYVFMCVCIFGAYAAHGGHLAVLWQPSEIVIIFGGGLGAMLVAYGPNLKVIFGSIPLLFKGSPYGKAFYMDLFALMYEILSKVRKEGLMSIEGDVENPDASPMFAKYASIAKDHHVVEFICDYLRLMVGGNLNAFEIENLMDVEIETHHHEAEIPVGFFQKLGDGLPAFGIVAAVMGVVHTMGSLHLPPTELGKLIGAALVGTFMGILLAYGFINPLAWILDGKAADSTRVFQTIKVTLLASLNGYAPQVAVEFGRKAMEGRIRPSFLELEEFVKNKKG